MIEFLEKYPTLVLLIWTAFVWPLGSGLILTLLDRWLPRTDEQWADLFARKPRTAAIVSFLKTAGWNVPGTVRSIRAYFSGPPPNLPLKVPPGQPEILRPRSGP